MHCITHELERNNQKKGKPPPFKATFYACQHLTKRGSGVGTGNIARMTPARATARKTTVSPQKSRV